MHFAPGFYSHEWMDSGIWYVKVYVIEKDPTVGGFPHMSQMKICMLLWIIRKHSFIPELHTLQGCSCHTVEHDPKIWKRKNLDSKYGIDFVLHSVHQTYSISA